MNIVFYILLILASLLIWVLVAPIFNKLGELVLNKYNKIKNIIEGDNNNE